MMYMPGLLDELVLPPSDRKSPGARQLVNRGRQTEYRALVQLDGNGGVCGWRAQAMPISNVISVGVLGEAN